MKERRRQRKWEKKEDVIRYVVFGKIKADIEGNPGIEQSLE